MKGTAFGWKSERLPQGGSRNAVQTSTAEQAPSGWVMTAGLRRRWYSSSKTNSLMATPLRDGDTAARLQSFGEGDGFRVLRMNESMSRWFGPMPS